MKEEEEKVEVGKLEEKEKREGDCSVRRRRDKFLWTNC